MEQTKKRYSIFLHPIQLKKLKQIGRKRGLVTAEMIRWSIDQFIEREEKKAKK